MNFLNNELKILLTIIKDNRDADNNPSIVHRWKALDNKLQLLDKTLAENKTELDIMKNYFSLFANQRT
jgi:hypothetical protein